MVALEIHAAQMVQLAHLQTQILDAALHQNGPTALTACHLVHDHHRHLPQLRSLDQLPLPHQLLCHHPLRHHRQHHQLIMAVELVETQFAQVVRIVQALNVAWTVLSVHQLPTASTLARVPKPWIAPRSTLRRRHHQKRDNAMKASLFDAPVFPTACAWGTSAALVASLAHPDPVASLAAQTRKRRTALVELPSEEESL